MADNTAGFVQTAAQHLWYVRKEVEMCSVYLPMLSALYRDYSGSAQTSNVSMGRLAERSAMHLLEAEESGGAVG